MALYAAYISFNLGGHISPGRHGLPPRNLMLVTKTHRYGHPKCGINTGMTDFFIETPVKKADAVASAFYFSCYQNDKASIFSSAA